MNYPTPQYPGYPAQQFPQQPQQGYPAPQQPYPAPQPQAYPQYPAQQFPQAPVQQPTTPPVQGTLDDFYNQPTTGSGPSISWKDKPVGTTYIGIVSRDVTNGDVQQQINFQSKQPEFYRDGRPKFVLKVPLKQILTVVNGQPAPAQEFAENGGEGTYFVRGQARDELARAMGEAGVSGAPKAGDVIQVTLTQRKPSGQGMNPANVVQIRYTPAQGGQAGGQQAAPVQAPAPAPVQEQQAYTGPVPQLAQQPAPQAAPVAQAPVQQQAAPAPQAQPAQQMPADLSPEQQQLLAKLTGQGAA